MGSDNHQSQSLLQILHQFQVSPSPPPPAASHHLHLTFLDYPFLMFRPMERLFFYDFPHPTLHFTQTILPRLNRSLSAALHHFVPLAGRLVSPPPPHRPYLLFSDGDSVRLTVAESTADFDSVVSRNQFIDVAELRTLVPQLPDSALEPDGTRLVPLLAVQITLFPGKGVCVGVQCEHVATDGMGLHHFAKFWAALFRSSQKTGENENFAATATIPLPSHDREVIRRAYPGLESVQLNKWFEFRSSCNFRSGVANYQDVSKIVQSTFVITRMEIETMKLWMLKANSTLSRLSAFVVISAFIWVTLIKSQAGADDLYHLNFVADCRRRLGIGLPASYFGNCLGFYRVSLKRSEAVAENGIVVAAEAIGRKVEELESGEEGLLRGAERWMPGSKKASEKGRSVWIVGSPKLKAYETDFGWGKPRRSEVVHVLDSRWVVLGESGDGRGGVEVGVAMARSKMEVFSGLFPDFWGHI